MIFREKTDFFKKAVLLSLIIVIAFVIGWFFYKQKISDIKIEKEESYSLLERGIENSTYYLVSYKNLLYSCEKLVFSDSDKLKTFFNELYEGSKQLIEKEEDIKDKKVFYFKEGTIAVIHTSGNILYFCSSKNKEVISVFERLFKL